MKLLCLLAGNLKFIWSSSAERVNTKILSHFKLGFTWLTSVSRVPGIAYNSNRISLLL